MKTSTLTQKGQVTIPKAIRDRFGWTQTTDLTFIQEDDGVRIVAVDERGECILEKMKAAKWLGPSTDELLATTRSEK